VKSSVFENPINRSLFLHLLLLMLVVCFFHFSPTSDTQNSPITIQLSEPKSNQKRLIYSNKDRTFKDQKSAKVWGAGKPDAKAKKINVSDLGIKLDTNKWSSHVLGEAIKGGDLVEGLEKADESILNTQESVYFTFFSRIHGQIYSAWDISLQNALRKNNGALRHLSSQDYYVTKTFITLNRRGEILKVQLLQDSGVVELDHAALTALNKAGPFLNPPKGLVNESGIAEFPLSFIIRN